MGVLAYRLPGIALLFARIENGTVSMFTDGVPYTMQTGSLDGRVLAISIRGSEVHV